MADRQDIAVLALVSVLLDFARVDKRVPVADDFLRGGTRQLADIGDYRI